jgi:pimeloyl-ACP methyl ester carboxylesterase
MISAAPAQRRRWLFWTAGLLFVLAAAAGIWARPPGAKRAKQGPVEAPETSFLQAYPALEDPARFIRSTDRRRAVVLIHGYWLHLKMENVVRAIFKDWQKKGSTLVTVLGKDSDVFAFAYGQTLPLEKIAGLKALADGVLRLRRLGYTEIVLVGHSAGGLVAREFIEDHPEAGVTKVVQVCSPNGGCAYAQIKLVPKNHRPFLDSLCKAGREKCLRERADKQIPSGVQFVCVITAEDFVVPCKCQWTGDLQAQGVPAVRIDLGHRQVMRDARAARQLAELIRQRQPRWSGAEVAAAQKDFFKVKKAKP